MDRGGTGRCALLISARTVRRIRYRAAERGVLVAVEERPRPGAPRKLSVEEETRLIALARSTPPTGYGRWTGRYVNGDAVGEFRLPCC